MAAARLATKTTAARASWDFDYSPLTAVKATAMKESSLSLPAPSSSAQAVAAVAESTPSKQNAPTPATVAGFFRSRVVRWTGFGTVVSAVVSCSSFVLIDDNVPMALTLLLSLPAVMGAVVSMALATLFEFAVGLVGLSSYSAPSPASPWKVALIPLVTSAKTVAITAGTIGLTSGMGFSFARDMYISGDDG